MMGVGDMGHLRSFLTNASVLVGSCFFALAGGELALRGLAIGPLPPLPVVMSAWRGFTDREMPYDGLKVMGRKITVGDLWGYHRSDRKLGYTVEENKVSFNGWWQSNNIGARSRIDTPHSTSETRLRTLIFGDSYAAGTRLPQEDTWPSLLEASGTQLEIVNLGVDGYSMAQAFLRYLSIQNLIEHDIVMIMFVPSEDLWRDVNVIRDLVYPWHVPYPQPRFILDGDQLTLVPNPYLNPSELLESDVHGLSEMLRNHLAMYDRFYFRSLYENLPVIGRLYSYKLAASIYARHARTALWCGLMRRDSEAMRVSHRIFVEMEQQVLRHGARFGLIILPTSRDLERFRIEPNYTQEWLAMTETVCAGIDACIDLAPNLRTIPVSEIDAGYDGGHYGPRMSRKIAEYVFAQFLKGEVLLAKAKRNVRSGSLHAAE